MGDLAQQATQDDAMGATAYYKCAVAASAESWELCPSACAKAAGSSVAHQLESQRVTGEAMVAAQCQAFWRLDLYDRKAGQRVPSTNRAAPVAAHLGRLQRKRSLQPHRRRPAEIRAQHRNQRAPHLLGRHPYVYGMLIDVGQLLHIE
jgi:hypothetical protein